MRLAVERALEMAAVFMIGDGLLGLTQPTRHVDLWRSDVAAVDALVRPFADRPGRRRAYGLLQATAGFALAARLRAGRRNRADRPGPCEPGAADQAGRAGRRTARP